LISVVALSVFAFGVVAYAVPQPGTTNLKAQRYRGAETEPGAADVEALLVYDDATRARGGVASDGESAEAIVFDQCNDSGFGHFMKNDDTFGYGTWSNQMIFGNGFHPGDMITGYEFVVYHSAYGDPGHNAGFEVELWDGDPMGYMDTLCSVGSTSAPIPGTAASFTDLPYSTLYRLRVDLPDKLVIDCDRVWMTVTMTEGCRAAWRIGGGGDDAWNMPPCVGFSDGYHLLYACEQFTACPTVNGYDAGLCCGDEALPCDHTDGSFECPASEDAGGTHPTFCGDGVADYFLTWFNDAPMAYNSLVGAVFSQAKATIRLTPVSADAPPEHDPVPRGWSISGNEIFVDSGPCDGRNVWLEIRLGDWDPDDAGLKLQAWQAALDSSGYSSGLQGELTIFVGPPCEEDADCQAVLGAASQCDPAGFFMPAAHVCNGGPLHGVPCEYDGSCPLGDCPEKGTCAAAFIDWNRDDWWCASEYCLTGVDLSTPDFYWGSTVLAASMAIDDPEPFPLEGLYGGSLVLTVPADAKGTFTIDLFPPRASYMVDQNSQFIPLVGVVPAKITIGDGTQACCLGNGGCEDVAAEDCLLLDGTPRSVGTTCDDGCEFDEACDACGPGEHWVDDCPEGQDFMPTALLAGIDLDGDCVPETNLNLGGAVAVRRCAGDPESHTIDTEIVAMTLTDGDVTIRAGADGGVGGVLRSSIGEIVVWADPLLPYSYFDVFFEVTGDGLPGPLYNHAPVRVNATIDCVPPETTYIHEDGCVPLYDSFIPGQGVIRAWLVEAQHRTFPPRCGDNVINQAGEECDGTDDTACPGQCLPDCTCPAAICGDDVVNQPGEMCDGTDDAACPGECLPDCACPGVIPTVSAWGTVIMTLLLLAAGKIYFGRRRAVT
jgi:hypothetical protein